MPLYEPQLSVLSQAEVNNFRLTGVSATPVMSSDNTALSTIYLSPFTGTTIALFNGSTWNLMTSAEVSLAVTGRTTDLPFDIFAYDNSGTLTLEFLNWTNATTRATALVRQDGVWVKSGDSTRRYVGSCRPRSATTYSWVQNGTDAPCRFDLFNCVNRLNFDWQLIASTNSWNYTTATVRQCQASTNYQIDLMVGLSEETFQGQVIVSSVNSSASTSDIPRMVGFGFDVTNAFSGIVGSSGDPSTVTSNGTISQQPSIGRHFYAWCEYSTTGGTTTWYGDNASVIRQSGAAGHWTC